MIVIPFLKSYLHLLIQFNIYLPCTAVLLISSPILLVCLLRIKSNYPYIYLSIYIFICVYSSFHTYTSFYLFTLCIFIYLSISIHTYIFLSIVCLFIYLSISIHTSFFLSIVYLLSIYLSRCLEMKLE